MSTDTKTLEQTTATFNEQQKVASEAARPTRRAQLAIGLAGAALSALGFAGAHGNEAKQLASGEAAIGTGLAVLATNRREQQNVVAALDAYKQEQITPASLPAPAESTPVPLPEQPSPHA